ncbi:flagellar hook-basal body complex protein (FliE) [Salinisphaera sp. S4-8]|uniref:flagellar hook-basal body complex protein FliE n=1 Tax=Salinisphaera sp. S4-8 TaxID=633357 RepID=UPI0033412408
MSISAVNLNSVLQQLQSTANQAGPGGVQPGVQAGPQAVAKSGEKAEAVDFSNALVAAIDRIDGMKQAAHAQGHAFERGVPGVGINDVMVDMQKASLGFEMGVQVRNRVVSAYREIMNMQV